MIFLFSGFGPAFPINLEPLARAVRGPLVLLFQGGEGWERSPVDGRPLSCSGSGTRREAPGMVVFEHVC